MKKLIRKRSLIFFIMILTLFFGCTKKDNVGRSNIILTETGFLDEKITEDGKNYIIIKTNGQDIKLEIDEIDKYNELEKDEFYIVAYDENNLLKSIKTEPFIKDLIERSMEEDIENTEITIINSQAKVNVEDLTLLDSTSIDFNRDGKEDTIELYADVEMYNGEPAWDDGQNWLLVVRDEDKDYVLFNDYVQLGNISFYSYFQDYEDNEEFVITTIKSGTAELKLTEYKFNKDDDSFNASTRFAAPGNVIMYHHGK